MAYSGRMNNSRFRLIQYDASPMSSQARVRHMVKKIWFKEGDNTNIKIFVAHNHDVADFNSLEYAKDLEEIDCTIRVSSIQAGIQSLWNFFMVLE